MSGQKERPLNLGDASSGLRKIIHIDMDAFFASVEQRDNPCLRGRPIAVGGSDGRGVVAAASYEARKFGVRSAMPSVTAKRLCPSLIFVSHRFGAYKEASRTIRKIFDHYTKQVEPLSLDEAYLDVTNDLLGIGSATKIADLIRQEIRAKTQLTASAGVSYNKFLAKIASDQNKPNGMCVIRPGQGAEFIAKLPIHRFYGVGPKGAAKMAKLGIETGADLVSKDITFLRTHFGKMSDYLYQAARGVDLRPVQAHRNRKSIGGERTFKVDISSGPALREKLGETIKLVWSNIERVQAKGRTVTLKIKYSDFRTVTRSKTLYHAIATEEEFRLTSCELLDGLLPLEMPIRLMGLSLSSLENEKGPQDTGDHKTQLALL